MKKKYFLFVVQIALLLMRVIPLTFWIILGSEYEIVKPILYTFICTVLTFLLLLIAINHHILPYNYFLPIESILCFQSLRYISKKPLAFTMVIAEVFLLLVLSAFLLKEKERRFRRTQVVITILVSTLLMGLCSIAILVNSHLTMTFYSPDRAYKAEVEVYDIGSWPSDTTVYIYRCDSKSTNLLFGRIAPPPVWFDHVHTASKAYDSVFAWTDEHSFQIADDVIDVLKEEQ